MLLTKPGVSVNLSIPDHRELDRGLIRDAGLTVQQFIGLIE